MTVPYTTPQQTGPHGAANPTRWAADTVATMREGARVRLDYSAGSLRRVDLLIDEIRAEGAPYEAVETALRGFGAYAGEVLVRHCGAQWWDTGAEPWLRTRDGRLWDPLQEARRRFAAQGSLRLMYRAASGAG
ncbi:hypothetical protein KUM39_16565 [Streptomyces sp. J2-1]|uniref:hypothetical protein n=1 Tax=Streptomyces corallincola TaxID=2851888 RepID=UPI001C38D172|nr:hypothetical protein [Streptomyces corallincola]MBV2355969.1 hypothetical protein [Streptomyces corallincola]